MTRYMAVAIYLGGVALFGALAARRWISSAPASSEQRFAIQPARSGNVDSLPVWLEQAEELVVSNDPFRLSNTPASVHYNPGNEGSVSPANASPAIRPVLTLKAIVGGPPWQAVIDGIPGQPVGAIARTGSTFDKLTVRAVTPDSVIIQGFDTSWVLSFRRHP